MVSGYEIDKVRISTGQDTYVFIYSRKTRNGIVQIVGCKNLEEKDGQT